MPRNCPDCQVSMADEAYHGVHVDACPECSGIWFDQGEMKRVMQTDPIALIELEEEHVPPAHDRHPEGAPRRCPDCDCVLDRFRYMYNSPVVLDSCAACGGVWVEDGELKKIQDWLDAARHPAGGGEELAARRDAVLAEFAAEHERTMGRLAACTAFFSTLNRRRIWHYSYI